MLGPEGIPASEHLVGMLWVHDIPIYPAYINLDPVYQSARAKRIFGWDSNTTFRGYWDDTINDYVTTSPANESPVVTSVYKWSQAGDRKVLFVTMNNSDSDVTVTITPNWTNLGMSAAQSLLDIYKNAATTPVVEYVYPSNGTFTFVVPARKFRALTATESDLPNITVANPSFETPVLTSQWTSTTVTSWTATSTSTRTASHPLEPSGDGMFVNPIGGNQYLMVGDNNDVYQNLGVNLEAGKTYTLTVWAGAREAASLPNNGYEVSLIVGDTFSSTQTTSGGQNTGSRTGTWTYLAQNGQSNIPIPARGLWLTQRTVVTGNADDLDPSWIGKPIWVLLHCNNVDTAKSEHALFDLVQVTKE